MIKILTIIPARSGSKGIPDKNIRIMIDKPLLACSIQQAKNSKYSSQMKIIVSTDSEKYAKIARIWGAEVPFLRPKEISQDLSTDYEFIKHALDWLNKNENYIPDIILQLRPTQPCREVKELDNCIKIFLSIRKKYDSLRTVMLCKKTPYKMFKIEKNKLIPYLNNYKNYIEPFNQCRQIFPKSYLIDRVY